MAAPIIASAHNRIICVRSRIFLREIDVKSSSAILERILCAHASVLPSSGGYRRRREGCGRGGEGREEAGKERNRSRKPFRRVGRNPRGKTGGGERKSLLLTSLAIPAFVQPSLQLHILQFRFLHSLSLAYWNAARLSSPPPARRASFLLSCPPAAALQLPLCTFFFLFPPETPFHPLCCFYISRRASSSSIPSVRLSPLLPPHSPRISSQCSSRRVFFHNLRAPRVFS